MGSGPSKQRIFICIELPAEVQSQLALTQGLLPKISSLRPTKPEQMHMTLRFLGDLTSDQIRAVADAVERSSSRSKPFAMSVSGLGMFPERGRPRVLWEGIGEGSRELMRLNESIEAELAGQGFARETSSFRPHLTLARIKPGGSPEEMISLRAFVQRRSETPRVGFTAGEVMVMRSVLGPSGSTHYPILKTPLGRSL